MRRALIALESRRVYEKQLQAHRSACTREHNEFKDPCTRNEQTVCWLLTSRAKAWRFPDTVRPRAEPKQTIKWSRTFRNWISISNNEQNNSLWDYWICICGMLSHYAHPNPSPHTPNTKHQHVNYDNQITEENRAEKSLRNWIYIYIHTHTFIISYIYIYICAFVRRSKFLISTSNSSWRCCRLSHLNANRNNEIHSFWMHLTRGWVPHDDDDDDSSCTLHNARRLIPCRLSLHNKRKPSKCHFPTSVSLPVIGFYWSEVRSAYTLHRSFDRNEY